jgi:hypothetical protein
MPAPHRAVDPGVNMKNMSRAIAALVVVSLLPGCATVVRGTKGKYTITSAPPAADVALSTGQTCVTPCKLKIKRKNGFTATISKPGYVTKTETVESKVSGGGGAAAAGNILAGGIIGGIVDGSNGSLNSFYPKSLDVTLDPTPAGSETTATTTPTSGSN